MKNSITKAIASALTCGACLLAATSSWGVQTVNLRAEKFIKTFTLPGGAVTNVEMWGFALDLAAPTVPGPLLTIPPGESELVVNLMNNLDTNVSIVIPGQDGFVRDGNHTTITDPQGRARAVSFVKETAVGATGVYRWINLVAGTFIYHSGSHAALQVQMGLYGMLTQDAVANQAYGSTFNTESILCFGEVDLDVHAAVQAGTYGTTIKSMIHSTPEFFLLNGEPYLTGQLPVAANETKLLRLVNACFDERIPVFNGYHLSVLAEDGRPYPYPKVENAVRLPALQTRDALLISTVADTVKFFDRRLLTIASFTPVPPPTETIPPTIVSVTPVDGITVQVVFSEPVASASAQTAGNYGLNNSASVSAAVLGADTVTVTLTTTPLNGSYVLTVNNVTDRATIPNPIAANTQVPFSFIPPDVTPPTIVSVAAVSATSVQVLFSESVALASAQTAANYAINNGVTVSAAALGADTRTVTLTTSTLLGGNYVLTVNNVTDLAAPPNTIAANSQAPFAYTPPSAGITFVAAASFTDLDGSSTETRTFNQPALTAGYVVVGVSMWDNASATTITGVTYGGTPMVGLGGISNLNSITEVYLYGLAVGNRAAGNTPIVVTGSSSVSELVFGVTAFSGVNQAVPTGPFASAEATSTAATVNVTTAPGDLVVAVMGYYRGTATETTGQGMTRRWRQQDNTDIEDGICSTKPATGASTTMSYTKSTATEWTLGSVALKPAP